MFPFDSHHAFVWKRNASYSDSISLDNSLKRRLFRAPPLIKSTTLIATFRTFLISVGKVLGAHASRRSVYPQQMIFFHPSNESRLQTKHGWSPIRAHPYRRIPRKLVFLNSCSCCTIFHGVTEQHSSFTELPDTKRAYTFDSEIWESLFALFFPRTSSVARSRLAL